MSTNRLIQCIVLLSVFCLFCGEARAEMLLLELTWNQPEPVTLPALYGLSAFDDRPGMGPTWGEDVTAFDHVSWADSGTVFQFNRVLTQVVASSQYPPFIGFHIGGQFPEGPEPGCATCWFSRLVANRADPFGTSEEWAMRVAEEGWEVDLRVPLLGENGLQGYTLTAMQRLVSSEAQTIRFYGVVPEPSASVMVLLWFLHISTFFRRSLGTAIAAGYFHP